MMHKKNLDFTITEHETGVFSGYAGVFGNCDLQQDVILPGAFKACLAKKNAGNIKILWQHNNQEVIGRCLEIYEDNYGLFIKAKLNLATQLGKEAYHLIKAGDLNNLSIGYQVVEEEYDSPRQKRFLKQLDLWEVSVVTFPANQAAEILEVKQADFAMNDFRTLLSEIIKSRRILSIN